PAAAQVDIQVDGEPGQEAATELRLSAGMHHLTVIGKEYEVEQQTFTVRRGRNADLVVTLRPTKRATPPVVPRSPSDATASAPSSEKKQESDLGKPKIKSPELSGGQASEVTKSQVDRAGAAWVLGLGGNISVEAIEGGVPLQVFPGLYGGLDL